MFQSTIKDMYPYTYRNFMGITNTSLWIFLSREYFCIKKTCDPGCDAHFKWICAGVVVDHQLASYWPRAASNRLSGKLLCRLRASEEKCHDSIITDVVVTTAPPCSCPLWCTLWIRLFSTPRLVDAFIRGEKSLKNPTDFSSRNICLPCESIHDKIRIDSSFIPWISGTCF